MKFSGQLLKIRAVMFLFMMFLGLTLVASPASAVCKQKTTGYFQLLQRGGTFTPTAPKGQGKSQITQPLTNLRGRPQSGRAVVLNRKKGNCLACHIINRLAQEPFHGEVGPNLSSVGRKFTEGQLRQFMVDSRVFNPRTLMPSYFIKTGLVNVIKKHKNKTILTAQEIEDVVAYLQTLK